MKPARIHIAAAIAGVILPTIAPGSAVLEGIFRDGSERPLADAAVVVACPGDPVPVRRTGTDADGRFRIDDLPAGACAVAAWPRNRLRPAIVRGIKLDADCAVSITATARPVYSVEGDDWSHPARRFAQEIGGVDGWIEEVAVRVYSPSERITATILDVETGRAIAPSRRIPHRFGSEGIAAAGWSAGEAVVGGGRRYRIEIRSDDDAAWVIGVNGRGDVVPGRHAWIDGMPARRTDLGMRVTGPHDGNAASLLAPGGYRRIRTSVIGQAFIARSASITAVAVETEPLADGAAYLRFSIHEGDPAGRQVGPARIAELVDGRTAVGWVHDETPVQPGRRYAIRVESVDGAPFLARLADDLVPGAAADAPGARVETEDLAACVCGPLSPSIEASLYPADHVGARVELQDPSFETDTDAWRVGPGPGAIHGPAHGVVPRWGARMFGWTARKTGADVAQRILQPVRLHPGVRYRFGTWLLTDQVGGRSSDVKVRLVVHADGADAGDTAGRPPLAASPWHGTRGRWVPAEVAFVAPADGTAAVGVEFLQRWPLETNHLYADGAWLAVDTESGR